jgi:hypothetical protein
MATAQGTVHNIMFVCVRTAARERKVSLFYTLHVRRPLVREGAPHRQNGNNMTKKIGVGPQMGLDTKTD